MNSPAFFSVIALLCLIPATLQPWLPGGGKGFWFWGSLVLALLGPLDWTLWQTAGHWPTALSADLWVMISASLLLWGGVSLVSGAARRLGVLMMPYLLLLATLASFSATVGGTGLSRHAPTAWVDLHILVSVATLGLLTVAAAAALACFIQSDALKRKRPTRLSRLLPPVTDSERLYEMLLIISELVLAAGVVTGMATQFLEIGRVLQFDHKTLFSLLAFVLIGALIAGRHWGGVRGHVAVRWALLAYSFVLVGYFGVKFVRQVLSS